MSDDVRALGGLAAVPIGQLRPSPNNPRENLDGEAIDDLARSIREVGLIQPIIVQRIEGHTGFQIVAGHRRFAAILRLGWATAPCVVRRSMLPDEELLAMLVENGQRAGLDPIEEARAMARLKSTGLTDKDIARKVGCSQPKVSGRLALLSLPVEEQEELRSGLMTIGAATTLAVIESGKARPAAKGKKSAAHFSVHHSLASRVKRRCQSKGHKRGGAKSAGGFACGECWEAVIRADEREQLHLASGRKGECVLCSEPHDPDRPNDNLTEASA